MHRLVLPVAMFLGASVGAALACSQLPIADISASTASTTVGRTVVFTSIHESDPDGGSLAYRWDLPAEAICISGLDERVLYCKFTQPGQFSVGLTVVDDEFWSASDWVSITAAAMPDGATWYASAEGSDLDPTYDGTSEATAFASIQTAVDCARSADPLHDVAGDAVVALPGHYVENLRMRGKNILLRGPDAADWVTVGSVVLDGGSTGSALTLRGDEGEDCQIQGLTITGGDGPEGLLARWEFEQDLTDGSAKGHDGAPALHDLSSDSACLIAYKMATDQSSITDFSGNGYHGTPRTSESPAFAPSGRYYGAYDFAPGDFISAGNAPVAGGELTVLAWVKFHDTTADADVCGKGHVGTGAPLFMWRDELVSGGSQTGNTDALSVMLALDGGETAWASSTSGSLNDADWHQVGFTFRAGCADGLQLYVDGQPDSTADTPAGGIQACSDALLLGLADGGAQPLDGQIGEFIVLTRALDPVEVLDAFHDGIDGLRGGLNVGVAYGEEPGSGDTSLLLDGISYVEVTDFAGVPNALSRTCCAWIRVQPGIDGPMSVLSWGAAESQQQWVLRIDESGRLEVDVSGAVVTGETVLTDGAWHHVAAVLEGGAQADTEDIRLYTDGHAEATTVSTVLDIDTSAAGHVCIGSCRDDHIHRFSGALDDVRVYGRALGVDEIQSLHGAKGLVSQWPFDPLTDFGDTAGENDGIAIGDAFVSPEGYVGDGSLYLDGVGDVVEFAGYKGVGGSRARSTCAWIRIDTSGGFSEGDILSWGSEVTGGRWLMLATNHTHLDYVSLRVAVCGAYIEGFGDLADGQWHHVAAVLEEGGSRLDEVRLYVDGARVSTYVTGPVAIDTTYDGSGENVTVGGYAGQGRYFKGNVDDVRIYSRGLSAEEVALLADRPTLAAEWRFEEPTGPSLDSVETITASWEGSCESIVEDAYQARSIGLNLPYGTTDRLRVADAQTRVFDVREHDDFAVSFWVRTSQSTASRILQKYADGSGFAFFLNTTASGTISFRTWSGFQVRTASAEANLNDGKWHHIVGVRRAGEYLGLYADGLLLVRLEGIGAGRDLSNTGDLMIGCDYLQTPSLHFSGAIDDLRFHRYALDSEEVRRCAWPEPNVEAYWPFEEGQGNRSADEASGHADDLVLNGGATWANGRLQGGLALDGIDGFAVTDRSLNLPDLTLCGWIRTDQIGPGHQAVFNAREFVTSSQNAGVTVYITPAGRLEFWTGCYAYPGTSGWDSLAATPPVGYIRPGIWTHIACSLECTSAAADSNGDWTVHKKIYVNGRLAAEGHGLYRPAFSMPMQIGAGWSGQAVPAHFFCGRVDELYVSSRVLSEVEVRLLCDSGGGVAGNGAEARFSNCIVRDNSNLGHGGGMADVNGIILGCRILNNLSWGSGGGIYCGPDALTRLSSCGIVGNRSLSTEAGGGGVFCASDGVLIRYCQIEGNEAAAGRGGGVLIEDGDAVIQRSRIRGNRAPLGDGGGLWIGPGASGDAEPYLRNCTIAGNTAARGAGIRIVGGSQAFSNCSLSGNQASMEGGGISAADVNSVRVGNSILWGNAAGQWGDQVAADSSVISYVNCDVQGCGGSGPAWNVALGEDLGRNIDADPIFPSATDPHLLHDSPCVNTGDRECDYAGQRDVDGDERVIGASVDIGADERRIPVVVHAGADKVLTMPVDTLELSDAIVSGGYAPKTTIRWTARPCLAGCAVDYDADVAGVQDSSSRTHPRIRLLVHPGSFLYFGEVVFRLDLKVWENGVLMGADELVITVRPGAEGQSAPVVMPGSYGPVDLTVENRLPLHGTVRDDGLPSGMLSTEWSVVVRGEGDQDVRIDGAAATHYDRPGDIRVQEYAANAVATFPRPGSYLLRLSATDGTATSQAHVEVVVTGPALAVDAGSDETVAYTDLPAVLDLSARQAAASVNPADAKVSWIRLSGPPNGMLFSDRNVLHPTITFKQGGTYVLRLTARSGLLTESDDAIITVQAGPLVEAGQDKIEYLQGPSVDICMADARVEECMFPEGDYSCEWSVLSGYAEGITNLNDQRNLLNPTLTFTQPGRYQFELLIRDPAGTGQTSSDDVWVSVVESTEPVPMKTVYIATTNEGRVLCAPIDQLGSPQWRVISQRLGEGVSSLCEHEGAIYASTLDYWHSEDAVKRHHGMGRVWRMDGSAWTPVGDGLGESVDYLTVYDPDPLDDVPADLYANGFVRRCSDCYSALWRKDQFQEHNPVSLVHENTEYMGRMFQWDNELYIGVGHVTDLTAYVYDGNRTERMRHVGINGLYCFGAYSDRFFGAEVFTGCLYELNDGSWSKVHKLPGIWGPSALAMCTFGGKLYVGTLGGQLHTYDGVVWSQLDSNALIGNINALASGPEYLLIGTGSLLGDDTQTGRIYRYNPQDNLIELMCAEQGIESGVTSILVSESKSPADMELGLSSSGGPVQPGGAIAYTISVANGATALENLFVVDCLAREERFVSASKGGIYDAQEHVVRWYFDSLAVNSDETLQFQTEMTGPDKPGGAILNTCRIEHDHYIQNAMVKTDIRPAVQGRVLYVDAESEADGGGRSWREAYCDLQSALLDLQAAYDAGLDVSDVEVWVAAGSYFPAHYDTSTDGDAGGVSEREPLVHCSFRMVPGVDVYGGFAGHETSRDQRDAEDEQNRTILTGHRILDYVVVGAPDMVLDGMTVTEGMLGGILCDYGQAGQTQGEMSIQNCRIAFNYGILPDSGYQALPAGGVVCQNSSPLITHNSIYRNRCAGVYCTSREGGTASPTIEANMIFLSVAGWGFSRGGHGVFLDNGTGKVTIRNNVIYGNSHSGICVEDWSAAPDYGNIRIWNNTFAWNGLFGVDAHDVSPPDLVTVKNCLLYECGLPWSVTADSCEVLNGQGINGIVSEYYFSSERYVGPDCLEVTDASAFRPGDAIQLLGGSYNEADGLPRIVTAVITEGVNHYIYLRPGFVPSSYSGNWDLVNLGTSPTLASLFQARTIGDVLGEGPANRVQPELGIDLEFVEWSGRQLFLPENEIFNPFGLVQLSDDDTARFVTGFASSRGGWHFFPPFDEALTGRQTVHRWAGEHEWCLLFERLTMQRFSHLHGDSTNPCIDEGDSSIYDGFTDEAVAVSPSGSIAVADASLYCVGDWLDVATGPASERTRVLGVNCTSDTLQVRPILTAAPEIGTDITVYPGGDLEGDPRILDGDGDGVAGVDIGADEYTYLPVEVDAGPDRVVALGDGPVQVSLKEAALSCSDACDPAVLDGLTAEWRQLSGPEGGAVFAEPTAVRTTAEFSEVGIYVLQLTAHLAGGRASDTVVVEVRAGVEFNDAPVFVEAGDTRTLEATFPLAPGVWHMPDSVAWRCPRAGVTFTPSDAAQTDVLFGMPGLYELIVEARKDDGLTARDSFWMPVNHQQWTAGAGADQQITWPDRRVYLHGFVAGGIPESIAWRAVGADGIVAFGASDALSTWAEFSEPGHYTIALQAFDAGGQVLASDVAEIDVQASALDLYPIDAGPDQVLRLVAGASSVAGLLCGRADVPLDATVEWVDLAGGGVQFMPISPSDVRAQFDSPGAYSIGLIARDAAGLVIGMDTATIEVLSQDLVVNAGPDIEALLAGGSDVTVFLSGRVTGTGHGAIQWICNDDSGSVTWSTGPGVSNASVQISAPGEYEFHCLALDAAGDVLAADDCIVTVFDATVGLDAGFDQAIDWPLDEAHLIGRVVDGTADTYRWVCNSDPAVEFGDATALDTWIKFPQPGLYQIALEGLVGGACVGRDMVTVKVRPQNGYSEPIFIEASDELVHLPANPGPVSVLLEVSDAPSRWEWVFTGPAGLIQVSEPVPDEPIALLLFFEPGDYDIGFVACDSAGQVIGAALRTIHVRPPRQEALVGSCSLDQPLPTAHATLSGSAEVEWVALNNSSFVTLEYTLSGWEAEFTEPGAYQLGLVSPNSGPIAGFDSIFVEVPPLEESIQIGLGDDLKVMLESSGAINLPLEWVVTGDTTGLQFQWLDLSGLAELSSQDTPDTIATLAQPGLHNLALVLLDTNGDVVAGDIIAIDVASFDPHSLYVDLFSPLSMTLFLDPYLDLTNTDGDPADPSDDRITLRSSLPFEAFWSPGDAAEYVSFHNPLLSQTFADIAWQGVYTLQLQADRFGTTAGAGVVEVRVDAPAVRLFADDAVFPFDTNPHSITVRTPNADTSMLTYEWDCLGGPVMLEPSAFGSVDVDGNTTVAVPQPGKYLLQVTATSGPAVVARTTMWLVATDIAPIVEAGEGYDVVSTGTTLTLDRARIWTDNYDEDDVVWSVEPSAGVNWIAGPTDVLAGQLTFDFEGIYTLTLTYQGFSDTVDIAAYDNAGALVDAGADKTAVVEHPLYLHDAAATPAWSDLTYKWSVVTGNEADVHFSPSDEVLCPTVTFDAAGSYTLGLTVCKDSDPFGYPDTVTVIVNGQATPYTDVVDPMITLEISQEEDFDPLLQSPASLSGDLWIRAIAEDAGSGLRSVKLGLQDTPGGPVVTLTPDQTTIQAGSSLCPQRVLLVHRLDPCSGSYTLTVTGQDRAGNQSSSAIDFTSASLIDSYSSEQGPGTVTLHATLTQAAPWTLTVLDSSGQEMGVREGSDATIEQVFDIGQWLDDRYQAVLAINSTSDSSTLYFDVANNITSQSITAQIATIDGQSAPADDGVLPPAKLIIQNGLCPVAGRAVVQGSSATRLPCRYKWTIAGDEGTQVVTPGYCPSGFAQGPIGVDEAESFGELDLTNLPNGVYTLTLLVTYEGNYAEDSVEVILDSPLKIGNLSFSQEDIIVPVGGYPISVIRTYDSFRRNREGDFGHGWTYTFSNMDVDLHEQREQAVDEGGAQYTRRISDPFDRDVTLTLPDGRRATFACRWQEVPAAPYSGCWRLVYDAPPGVTAALETSKTFELAYGGMYLGYFWVVDGTPFASDYTVAEGVDLKLHDVPGLRLKTTDGFTYNIGRKSYGEFTVHGYADSPSGTEGTKALFEFEACAEPYLESIDLPNGDRIEFDREQGSFDPAITGVRYMPLAETNPKNPLKAIEIVRDARGRITAIRTPADAPGQESLQYAYDPHGNLKSVSKLIADGKREVTTYSYQDENHTPDDHYVTAIQDGRGLDPIQYCYDGDGRLIGTRDAKGNYLTINHDVAGKRETVYDRSDIDHRNPTVYEYNGRGNVLSVTKYVDHVVKSRTEYEYNSAKKAAIDQPTRVSETQSFSPPMQAVTTTEYDDQARPQIVIDPLQNKTQYAYDEIGNVTQSRQFRFDDPAYTLVAQTVNNYWYRDDAGNLYESTAPDRKPTNLLRRTEVATKIESGAVVEKEITEYEYTQPADGCVLGLLKTIKRTDGAAAEIIVSQNAYNQAYSNSPDQPYCIASADGTKTYQHFDDNGNMDASWYYARNAYAGNLTGAPDIRILTLNELDRQGRTIRTLRVQEEDANEADDPAIAQVWANLPTYEAQGSALVLSETEYDDAGRAVVSYDHDRNRTEYAYDPAGQLVETRFLIQTAAGYLLQTLTETLCDADGRVLVQTDPHAPSEKAPATETVYNAQGQVVQTRRWEEVTIPLVGFYVEEGLVRDDGDDMPGWAVLAGRKVPHGITPANAGSGGPVGWLVNDANPVAGGQISTTRTDYDAAGRTHRTYAPNQNGVGAVCTAQYVYDILSRQTEVITLPGPDPDNPDPQAPRTETHYNGLQRDWVQDAMDNQTSFSCDAAGRVIMTTHPPVALDGDGLEDDITYTHVGYDEFGRKAWESAQTKQPDPTHTDAPAEPRNDQFRKREYGYDAAGRLTDVWLPAVPDPENQGTPTRPHYSYFYDPVTGDPVATVDPKGRVTVTAYDQLHQRHKAWRPTVPQAGGSPILRENIDEQVISDLRAALAADPLAPCEQWWHNAFGQVLKHRDFKGQVTLYYYYEPDTAGSDAGRPGQLKSELSFTAAGDPWQDTSLPMPDETTLTPAGRIEHTCDRFGRKSTETLDNDTWQYHYDPHGRLHIQITPQGALQYTYNPITGQKSAVKTYPAGTPWEQIADGTAEPTIVTETTYAHDDLGRLDEVDAVRRNNSTIAEVPTMYAYNANGSRESVQLPNGVFTEYQYNPQNRLEGLIHFESKPVAGDPPPPHLSEFTYTHFADGMRRTLAEQLDESRTITYSYDALNRITGEEALQDDSTNGYNAAYGYDLAGNRKSRTVEAANGTLITAYTYNDLDQLETETHTGPTMAFLWQDEPVYVYASAGDPSYSLPGGGPRIGSLRAWLKGMPSPWSHRMLLAALLLLAAAAFWPVLLRQWRRFTGRPASDSPVNLSLYHRCLCILLAAIFLIGPETFQSLAQADVQYAQLSTFTWADGGTVTTYTYDANGSLETKHTVKNGSTTTEKLRYLYNLQGRLAEIQDIQTNPAGDTLAAYAYNPQGIRVKKVEHGTTTVTTDYLIDPDNPTGYAQVLEEWTGGPVPAVTYTIGDDIIAQTDGSNNTEYLLYDGHGSTRQLADDSTPVVVTDSYSYDAYGAMLGGNPAAGSCPGTRLLYAGEHFDEHAQHYYNRARWYNPQTGCFNRTDPHPGSAEDPRSLHKYLYCHGNPINGYDPSGLTFLSELGIHVHREIGRMYRRDRPASVVSLGRSIPGLAGELLPDIMDFTYKEIGEVKPLSSGGITRGAIQLPGYLIAANALNVPGAIDKIWTPSTWDVGVRNILLPEYYAQSMIAVTIGNACGLIFYKVFRIPTDAIRKILIASLIASLAEQLKYVGNQLKSLAQQGYDALEGSLAYLSYQADVAFGVACSRHLAIFGLGVGLVYMAYAVKMRLALFPVIRM